MKRLSIALLLALPSILGAQSPPALGDSDLAVGGLTYGQDSALVRRLLGRPISTDSLTGWLYADLRVWFENSRVHQIAIIGRRLATRRGLRIGDPVARAAALYGSPCAKGAYIYCLTDQKPGPNELGILLEVRNGRVTRIYLVRSSISSEPRPNKRLKLAARVDEGMNLSSARRSLSAIR